MDLYKTKLIFITVIVLTVLDNTAASKYNITFIIFFLNYVTFVKIISHNT